MRKVETPVDMMPYHPDLDSIDEYDFVNDCFFEEVEKGNNMVCQNEL